jgi:S-DNA-T family DNA segregation ATPase FtsK/SpoIIIE
MAAIGTTEPQYAAELVNLQPAASGDAPKGGASPKDKDDLYEAAVEVVIREGRGSVSLLQRALGVGYGRGARLIDFMAEDGVVGQYAGSQAREVLITMEQWAARNGTAPLPPDPAPRKLKIQPHAEHVPAPAAIDDDDEEADREDALAEDDEDTEDFPDEDYDDEADDEDAGDE